MWKIVEQNFYEKAHTDSQRQIRMALELCLVQEKDPDPARSYKTSEVKGARERQGPHGGDREVVPVNQPRQDGGLCAFTKEKAQFLH